MDHLHDLACFIFTVEAEEIVDLFTGAARGPEFFVPAFGVVGDHRVGCGQDVAGGAVVLLQFDHLGAGEVFLKVKDIADIGTAKSIDRLVVVTDHAEVAVTTRQQPEQAVLDRVGVLVFVDHLVTEAALV